MSAKLTLKRFRELTAHLPEEAPIYFHAYEKGCCLSNYTESDLWIFPKEGAPRAVVINPGEDYDARKPKAK